MIDTYSSDHCRHTTFGTVLENVQIDDEAVKAAFEQYLAMRHELGRDEKPVCLMDMGTIGAKWLKAKGILKNLDESEEINACTVKIKCDVNGEEQDWLYLFKNETHNHPTEIEPFGGAATCVGGADPRPLVGPQYVYQAMRLTGAADPTVPVSETLEGKLPQRSSSPPPQRAIPPTSNQDRSCNGSGQRAVSSGLRRQAHGNRRRGGRHPGRPRCVARRLLRGDWWCSWAAAPAATASEAPPALRRPTTWTASRPAAPRCRRATPPSSARFSVFSVARTHAR